MSNGISHDSLIRIYPEIPSGRIRLDLGMQVIIGIPILLKPPKDILLKAPSNVCRNAAPQLLAQIQASRGRYTHFAGIILCRIQ